MINLFDITEIVEVNNEFTILKVTGDKLQCIQTGVLDGDEDFIRVSHDEYNTITIYDKAGTHYSWASNTCVTDLMQARRVKIMDCLKFGYHVIPNKEWKGKYPTSKKDIMKSAIFQFAYWRGANDGNVRIGFEKAFVGNHNYDEFKKRWGGNWVKKESGVAVTGCIVETWEWKAARSRKNA